MQPVPSQTVVCPTCSTEMPEQARYCPNCGEIRTKYRQILGRAASLSSARYDYLAERFRNDEPLPLDTRQAILQDEIQQYIGQGYRVLSQTPTSAQLEEPKRADGCVVALLAIFTLGLGLLIYLIMMSSAGRAVYLTVDEWGEVHVSERS